MHALLFAKENKVLSTLIAENKCDEPTLVNLLGHGLEGKREQSKIKAATDEMIEWGSAVINLRDEDDAEKVC